MVELWRDYVEETFSQDGKVIDFKLKVPDNFVFAYDVLDKLAEKNPDSPALTWCDDNGREKLFSFADIKKYSDAAASVFQKKGIKKGDVVMLVLRRHFHFWFAIMGLNKLGAVAVPATNQLQEKDFLYRFEAADIKGIVAIAEDEVCKSVDSAAAKYGKLEMKLTSDGKFGDWGCFDELLEQGTDFTRPTDQSNDDDMLLYFTSGTTGMPKMVAHDNTYPIAHIPTAKYWHNVVPGKPHLTVSETGWAKSVWGKLYGQWFMEATVFAYDMERFNPITLLEKVSHYKVATFCAPPTIYRMLIQEDLSGYDLSSLCYGTVAGEALNPEVFNKFYEATGIKLYEGFGQTETTLTACTYSWVTPVPGAMGKPSPAYDVHVVRENGEDTDPGEIGEIVLYADKDNKPVGMFKGYHKAPEITDRVWYDGCYHTGDMAWKDENGYLWFDSRIDDVIKSSGYRIGPFEVESVLMEHPAVLECAVTGVPDPVRGTAIKATIVLTKKYSPSEQLIKEIQDFVKNTTAPYKYPRIIEFVTELPKTISGKIRRVEIRENDSAAN